MQSLAVDAPKFVQVQHLKPRRLTHGALRKDRKYIQFGQFKLRAIFLEKTKRTFKTQKTKKASSGAFF